MKIYFLIFDKVEELDLAGPWELIGLLANKGLCEPPKLISLNTMTPTGTHGLRLSADCHFKDYYSSTGDVSSSDVLNGDIANSDVLNGESIKTDFPDIIIVPGGSGARIAMQDKEVLQFLQDCDKHCQALLSVCTGLHLLQAAGLLKGRKATTHWAFLEQLKADKSVTVIEERFVNDSHIWSSAGVSAGMDMLLAFIKDTFGEDIAAAIQLAAEYYPSPTIYGSPQDNPEVSQYIRDLNN